MSPDTPPVRVLFVAGWGRSGSTLLDRLLNLHPEVVGVGELRDVWLRGPVENRPCGCGAAFRTCDFWNSVGQRAFGGWSLHPASSLASLRPKLDRPWHLPMLLRPELSRGYARRLRAYAGPLAHLYRAIADEAGARVVVDSSNIATNALLLRHVPGVDVRLVHLIRDSRGVVNSWRKQVPRPGPTDQVHGDQMPTYGVAGACLRYDGYNVVATWLRDFGVPYLRMRYEDLVEDPDTQLARALQLAGLDPAACPRVGHRVELGPHHSIDGNPSRLRHGEVTLRVDGDWSTTLPTPARWLTSAMTGPLLWRYGYLTRSAA